MANSIFMVMRVIRGIRVIRVISRVIRVIWVIRVIRVSSISRVIRVFMVKHTGDGDTKKTLPVIKIIISVSLKRGLAELRLAGLALELVLQDIGTRL